MHRILALYPALIALVVVLLTAIPAGTYYDM